MEMRCIKVAAEDGLYVVNDYVVTHNTNSKKPNMAQLVFDIQFSAYTYASHQPEFWETLPNGEQLYERFLDTPRRNIWFQVMDGVEIDAGSRDEKDFERLYQLCVAVQKAHDVDLFVPRIGDACTYCPYHEPCGLKLPTREELAAEDNAWL